MTSKPLVFVDTETTHLNRRIRRAWEIALIRREPDGGEAEHTLLVAPEDLDLANADPMALKIGRFYQRHPRYTHNGAEVLDEKRAAEQVEVITRSATLVGAVPSFDEETLDAMLRRRGLCPSWHHRLIDVRVYAAGVAGADPGWGFEDAVAEFGLSSPDADRHTALGDARLARDLFDAAQKRVRGTADDVFKPVVSR